jgi:hypothetical protein
VLITHARAQINAANVANSVSFNYGPLLRAIRQGIYPNIAAPANAVVAAAGVIGLSTPDMQA